MRKVSLWTVSSLDNNQSPQAKRQHFSPSPSFPILTASWSNSKLRDIWLMDWNYLITFQSRSDGTHTHHSVLQIYWHSVHRVWWFATAAKTTILLNTPVDLLCSFESFVSVVFDVRPCLLHISPVQDTRHNHQDHDKRVPLSYRKPAKNRTHNLTVVGPVGLYLPSPATFFLFEGQKKCFLTQTLLG